MRSKMIVLGLLAAMVLGAFVSSAEAGRRRARYRGPMTNFSEWFASVTTFNRS